MEEHAWRHRGLLQIWNLLRLARLHAVSYRANPRRLAPRISETMNLEPDPLQLKLDRLFATIEDRKRRQSDERKKKQDQRIQQLTTRRPLWWQND